MYRVRPSLWDSSNANYKNKNRRHDGIIEIAVTFRVEMEEIERKIKNLQSHSVREKKKRKARRLEVAQTSLTSRNEA
nr:unnamed protein product [Callosobruchus chinensis]